MQKQRRSCVLKRMLKQRKPPKSDKHRHQRARGWRRDGKGAKRLGRSGRKARLTKYTALCTGGEAAKLEVEAGFQQEECSNQALANEGARARMWSGEFLLGRPEKVARDGARRGSGERRRGEAERDPSALICLLVGVNDALEQVPRGAGGMAVGWCAVVLSRWKALRQGQGKRAEARVRRRCSGECRPLPGSESDDAMKSTGKRQLCTLENVKRMQAGAAARRMPHAGGYSATRSGRASQGEEGIRSEGRGGTQRKDESQTLWTVVGAAAVGQMSIEILQEQPAANKN